MYDPMRKRVKYLNLILSEILFLNWKMCHPGAGRGYPTLRHVLSHAEKRVIQYRMYKSLTVLHCSKNCFPRYQERVIRRENAYYEKCVTRHIYPTRYVL